MYTPIMYKIYMHILIYTKTVRRPPFCTNLAVPSLSSYLVHRNSCLLYNLLGIIKCSILFNYSKNIWKKINVLKFTIFQQVLHYIL